MEGSIVGLLKINQSKKTLTLDQNGTEDHESGYEQSQQALQPNEPPLIEPGWSGPHPNNIDPALHAQDANQTAHTGNKALTPPEAD